MTRKMFLIAGVAGFALTAPAVAERGGHNKGGEASNVQQQPQRAERQQVQRAERPQRMERQQVQRAERPQRMERQQVQRAERQQMRIERQQAPRMERQQARQVERAQRIERQQVQRAERPQRIERAQRIERRQVRHAERPQRMERAQRIEHQQIRAAERPQRVERAQRIDRQQVRQAELAQRPLRQEAARIDRRELKQLARQDRQAFRARLADQQQTQFASIVDSRDMRPMREIRQQRVALGDRVLASALAPVPVVYQTRYVDTPDYLYRYDDDFGYVYRINRTNSLVSGLYPLFGGYSIGDPWPSMYRSSYVPYGYQAYYYDTPDYYYRYDGNAIYQVDAGTQLISGIVALLLGQSLGIGQMLPTSYNTYNVPLAYRSSYYDTNDAWYRYGDGFIYQVDPYSRRIEDRYPLYADSYGYTVGQPWPVAYPGYNVPYAYQDMYYDTPQYNYRYANGGIYQVDPTTQLITALVALVSGQQFGIGQPMPAGYSAYNVPFAYRDRYYDTDDDFYRYANGYVYEIDKSSGLIENAYPVYA